MSSEHAVPNGGVAAVRAYDALVAAGCESVEVETPRRTRSTWIVEASCAGACCDAGHRVHIDPLTGGTRLVEHG